MRSEVILTALEAKCTEEILNTLAKALMPASCESADVNFDDHDINVSWCRNYNEALGDEVMFECKFVSFGLQTGHDNKREYKEFEGMIDLPGVLLEFRFNTLQEALAWLSLPVTKRTKPQKA